VLAGLAAGAIWTWVQPDRYRADARLLVRPSTVRPAVEALAQSSLVEANVAQTLRLSSPPEISARRGDGGVLTVSVEAGSRERARQIDAEAVVILMQTVERRFNATDVTATVLDPAHAAERTSPTPGRNLLIAVLAGLVAGIAAAVALAEQRRPVASGDPRAERRLNARLDQVAKRERALARRAGELAVREQELQRRQGALSAAPPPSTSPPRLEPERRPELETEAESQPEPAASAPVAAADGWNLEALRARVDARAADYPDRVDEWRSYLFFLRDHADVDGRLPSNFDGLVLDVFEPLLR